MSTTHRKILVATPLFFLSACSGKSNDANVADDTSGNGDTAGDETTVFDPPEWCEEALADELQSITTTEASPYYVHHPATDSLDVHTVVFLPGGDGSQGSSDVIWNSFLSGGDSLDQVRVVMPYADDDSLLDEYDRSIEILDEVLQCYGGDPDHVHLGGTSNGGVGAYGLMLDNPGTFATLLGAPGVFESYPNFYDEAVHAALDGKAVYNGVGENDDGWNAAVEVVHEYLVEEGIDSVFVEFEGEGHVLTEEFDETVFFDFWLAH